MEALIAAVAKQHRTAMVGAATDLTRLVVTILLAGALLRARSRGVEDLAGAMVEDLAGASVAAEDDDGPAAPLYVAETTCGVLLVGGRPTRIWVGSGPSE